MNRLRFLPVALLLVIVLPMALAGPPRPQATCDPDAVYVGKVVSFHRRQSLVGASSDDGLLLDDFGHTKAYLHFEGSSGDNEEHGPKRYYYSVYGTLGDLCR